MCKVVLSDRLMAVLKADEKRPSKKDAKRKKRPSKKDTHDGFGVGRKTPSREQTCTR